MEKIKKVEENKVSEEEKKEVVKESDIVALEEPVITGDKPAKEEPIVSDKKEKESDNIKKDERGVSLENALIEQKRKNKELNEAYKKSISENNAILENVLAKIVTLENKIQDKTNDIATSKKQFIETYVESTGSDEKSAEILFDSITKLNTGNQGLDENTIKSITEKIIAEKLKPLIPASQDVVNYHRSKVVDNFLEQEGNKRYNILKKDILTEIDSIPAGVEIDEDIITTAVGRVIMKNPDNIEQILSKKTSDKTGSPNLDSSKLSPSSPSIIGNFTKNEIENYAKNKKISLRKDTDEDYKTIAKCMELENKLKKIRR
ncbi:MAG: hypothetical protein PHY08_09045 [Candidatus Cloacimonetes bacterium]|nr:hypothetical protein [Candidatus Cloacimonadota bacterium]